MGKMDTDVKVREAASAIDALITPSLLLDRGRLERNIQRLAERAGKLGVVLRPHMKTAKSIDVARHVFPREPGPITVSTIVEAEYFAGHGFRDMTYAVGMSPASAIRAMELCRRTGADLKLLSTNSPSSPVSSHSTSRRCWPPRRATPALPSSTP
jgi:D-serine deaminase-like pyridoxal phosphate-dependent protein